MKFKEIDDTFRPIPFWSWNEELEPEETEKQIAMMHEVGIGGFFMHARGGLQTEYMGKYWFENVNASIDAAKKYNMQPWAYDENGWPSGFGGGIVNSKGEKYQQKYLRMEEKPLHYETQICKCGEHWFYYEVNPYYVDTLDAKVIKVFIDEIYQPYYEKYGNDIEGFFTDEPQISRNGIPWSFVFEKEYEKRYKEKLTEHLEELFLPVGDYKKIRIKFWKMVTDLFSKAFVKQIYDWCCERKLKLTGHLSQEENLEIQITSNGACMPHYEYFHIPGVDWLGKKLTTVLPALQVSSVARQLGKEKVLTESFALCGHGISLTELKGIFEWQAVRGINLLCQHLEGYSIRGIRKRDYPPAMYYQQPWWCEYRRFVEAIARESTLLKGGSERAKVLLLHPQTTAWSLFDNGENKGLKELDKKLLSVICELEKKHIQFHFGDETIMERHAYVKNGKLVIGTQNYEYVITSCCEEMFDNTKKLLHAFKEEGGKIVTATELEENPVTESSEITYTVRYYDDYTLHFFVNSTEKTIKADINVRGQRLNIYTGETEAFSGRHTFNPWESLMVIEEKSENKNTKATAEETTVLMSDTVELCDNVENVITLDRCDYYFDGVLEEENGYVLNICERANRLKRPVNIHQQYRVQIEKRPQKLFLVCETPQKFEIAVNGHKICDKDLCDGYFVDKSFKKIDIADYIMQGENLITFDCEFKQSEEFYQSLEKAYNFESEKNKLAYDFEIEAIYLVGNFGVKTDGEWTELSNNRVRYKGEFVIDELPKIIKKNNIERQGFPFFCGKLELFGDINILGDNPVLKLMPKGINVLKIEINGKEKVFFGESISLKEFDAEKITRVKLTIINNLRNLLGPHHLKNEEIGLGIGPYSFYKEKSVWNEAPEENWDEDYCFETMGL